MVVYLTSKNIKLLQRICDDYVNCENNLPNGVGATAGNGGHGESAPSCAEDGQRWTPFEYMKHYVDLCPELVSEDKLTWIAESFLSLQKHMPFLRALSLAVRGGLGAQHTQLLAIVFHALVFQATPVTHKDAVYAALFHVSKDLLKQFCAVFSNSEVVSFVGQLASEYYDSHYVTRDIITPLFEWQPYIGEMGHDFSQYQKKVALRRYNSPPTIPCGPAFSTRFSPARERTALVQHLAAITGSSPRSSTKGHKATKMIKSTPVTLPVIAHPGSTQNARTVSESPVAPAPSPPPSPPSPLPRLVSPSPPEQSAATSSCAQQEADTTTTRSPRRVKMLTRSEIDIRLRSISERNKQRAAQLLSSVKALDPHYAKPRTKVESRPPSPISKPPKKRLVYRGSPRGPAVRDTLTSLRRMGKAVARVEQAETQWLRDAIDNCTDTVKIEGLIEEERIEKEKERKLHAERVHLRAQISFEDAIICKQEVTEENKRRYARFVEERDAWIQQIEEWKAQETKRARDAVEKTAMMELQMMAAREGLVARKRTAAKNWREKTEQLVAEAMKEISVQLEQRAAAIKELKVLSLVAREAALPRTLDLTQTAGVGLLAEMSLAELRERLDAMKLQFREQLEVKRLSVKTGRDRAKQELEDTRRVIELFLTERAEARALGSGGRAGTRAGGARAAARTGSGDVCVATDTRGSGLAVDKEIAELREKLQTKKTERQKLVASKNSRTIR